MVKIDFTNEQFQKLVELVYLGRYMKNCFYTTTDEKYDIQADGLQDHLAQFAKEYGMQDFLCKDWSFSNELDDVCRSSIDMYDVIFMFENLAESFADRDFANNHDDTWQTDNLLSSQRDQHTDKHDDRELYHQKYHKEFLKYGIKRLQIVWQ